MRNLHTTRCEKCNGKGKIFGRGYMFTKCTLCTGVGRIDNLPNKRMAAKPKFEQAKFDKAAKLESVPAGDGGGGDAESGEEDSPDDGKKKKRGRPAKNKS